MKYLPLYYEWMKDGLPQDGLCNSLDHDENLEELLSPDGAGSSHIAAFWGFEGEERTMKYRRIFLSEEAPIITRSFTPLRQNIVLLLAAMNEEL